jgi:hypothetical protein
MKKKTLFIPIFLLLIVAILILFSFKVKTPLSTSPSNSQLNNEQVVQPNLINPEKLELHATQDGQTAFDLLKNNADIETKQYDFGIFIESVNGLKGDDQHFWAFYVNDQKSQTGADTTILKKGDVAKFVWEKIEI